jgi:hypothetical protein
VEFDRDFCRFPKAGIFTGTLATQVGKHGETSQESSINMSPRGNRYGYGSIPIDTFLVG